MSELLHTVHAKTNTLTGLILPRQEVIQQQHWCRSTNVFVMNSEGKILCHQRSLQKERMPGVWTTHLGGHVAHQESYESNAQKELQEEAGILVDSKKLIPFRTTAIASARLWVRDFVTLIDAPVESFTPQPGEVDQFAWYSIEEILSLKEQHPEHWCAGTHDLWTEYHCFRAVLTAAQSFGLSHIPPGFDHWNPLFV